MCSIEWSKSQGKIAFGPGKVKEFDKISGKPGKVREFKSDENRKKLGNFLTADKSLYTNHTLDIGLASDLCRSICQQSPRESIIILILTGTYLNVQY